MQLQLHIVNAELLLMHRPITNEKKSLTEGGGGGGGRSNIPTVTIHTLQGNDQPKHRYQF